jgi:hypothetical protein
VSELAGGEAAVHGDIANTVAGTAGLNEAAEAVLKWWWGAHDKHIGYMAVGGYGSVTGKNASHMTAELLLAIAKRQKVYRSFHGVSNTYCRGIESAFRAKERAV